MRLKVAVKNMIKEEESFNITYSKYYDILYMDKDYDKECDFVEEAFNKYSLSKPVKILDVGCGTGGHLIPLAKRGYEVVGIMRAYGVNNSIGMFLCCGLILVCLFCGLLWLLLGRLSSIGRRAF
jgi:SAM-dependent methyltransferase